MKVVHALPIMCLVILQIVKFLPKMFACMKQNIVANWVCKYINKKYLLRSQQFYDRKLYEVFVAYDESSRLDVLQHGVD